MASPLKLPMAGQALRNLLSRPATRRYPFEVREPIDGARGHIQVDLARCVFCGLCARRCPAVAIAVSRELKTLSIEHLRCIACGVCCDVCNKDSLSMLPQPPLVCTAREAAPGGSAPRGLETSRRDEAGAVPAPD